MQNAQVNLRLQRIVTLVAVLLFGIKLLAWWLTRSVAILTDALESTVNVVAGFISLYSLYVAAKPRDEDHPYGHGKAEFVSAAVEGSMIAIAGGVIIYESIHSLISPSELKKLDSGIILVSITAIINYLVGYICVKTGKKNNSLALIASGKHLQSDTYSTVGIVAGLILIYFSGWTKFDAILAMGMALFIIYTGYTIIRSSIEGIMDKADIELLQKLVDYLNQNRRVNWIDLHNVRIIKFGSILHLDAHLTVPWYLNVHEAHLEVDELSRLIRNEYGESLEMFIHTDGCLDFSCTICSKTDCAVRRHIQKQRVEWTVENIISNKKHGAI
ncbi:MAG TPA: cation diffusion facilitator family transporter [Chitinophagaceae bacterium]|nr:cation diffusion facilitator family transporter [Chitinophagaceae bacterium]